MANISYTGDALVLSGALSVDQIPPVLIEAKRLIKHHHPLRLDLSALESIDSAGVACVEEIIAAMNISDKLVIVTEAPPEIQNVISTFSSTGIPHNPILSPRSYFEQVGHDMLTKLSNFGNAFLMASEIWYWSLIGIFNRTQQRKGALVVQSLALGFDALPIVSLLSFIIGFILSLQSAVQLKTFGANIFIADLLSVTMVREMGPILTAIIVAGRSGSAIASEVATMQVTEELDALKMMALNPIRYVIVPKFHAITLVMPILVAFSILVSMMGGAIIALGYLDLSVTTFVTRSIDIISIKDLLVTFIKSTVFAWLIVIIGTHYGFQVKGGAEGVGKATTASVVASIFAVIIADAVFSLLYL